jgi:hypothetical protein
VSWISHLFRSKLCPCYFLKFQLLVIPYSYQQLHDEE